MDSERAGMTGSLGRGGASCNRDWWVMPPVQASVPLPGCTGSAYCRQMIRRHSFWFRALLMAADALLAVGLLIVLSAWRFGPDWAVWWREIVPEPAAFVTLYVVGWITVLTRVRPVPAARALVAPQRGGDIIRATVVMALITLSVLFLFKLPDVSRLLLLVLFPALAAATPLRSAPSCGSCWSGYRRQGRNLRFVLVLGAGPRGAGVRDEAREPP